MPSPIVSLTAFLKGRFNIRFRKVAGAVRLFGSSWSSQDVGVRWFPLVSDYKDAHLRLDFLSLVCFLSSIFVLGFFDVTFVQLSKFLCASTVALAFPSIYGSCISTSSTFVLFSLPFLCFSSPCCLGWYVWSRLFHSMTPWNIGRRTAWCDLSILLPSHQYLIHRSLTDSLYQLLPMESQPWNLVAST